MLFIDSEDFFVYSALDRPFADANSDGVGEPIAGKGTGQYNRGRPTVNGDGAITALLDGHVERVAYKRLWGSVSAANSSLLGRGRVPVEAPPRLQL
jgi:hypothetical protein